MLKAVESRGEEVVCGGGEKLGRLTLIEQGSRDQTLFLIDHCCCWSLTLFLFIVPNIMDREAIRSSWLENGGSLGFKLECQVWNSTLCSWVTWC